MIEEDEEEEYEAMYSNGHWVWDDRQNELKFISDIIMESQTTSVFVPITMVGPVHFRDDIDLVEQQRYKKRIQRKWAGANDVVMLQDVKDIALYCAPMALLCPKIINMLHTSTTERFLRALILYCQYYLQMADVMELRSKELQTKIPTLSSKAIEKIYEEDLNDLRLVVAKEYCTIILGGDDLRQFHHMGKDKMAKSLTRKEALIFEPLIRLSVKIVWIALARRSYSQIDVEINRLFRSKRFNMVEHNLKIDVEKDMAPGQRQVLRGACHSHSHILKGHSPLFDETICDRKVDFKMLGLGVIKYKKLDGRLKFIENYLIKPETKFPDLNITLGIIGMKRDRFDPMLREIEIPPSGTDEKRASSMKSLTRRASKASSSTISKKSTSCFKHQYYPPIYLPDKSVDPHPAEFPAENQQRLTINATQRRMWLTRVTKRTARSKTIQSQKSK